MHSPEQEKQLLNLVKETLSLAGIGFIEVGFSDPQHSQNRPEIVIKTNQEDLIIGSDGANLAALQVILRRMASSRYSIREPFYLDVNQYRQKEREKVIQTAQAIAKRARSFQTTIEMDPMPSYKRFVVHNTLSEFTDIETYSEGKGLSRRVVVCYKKGY